MYSYFLQKKSTIINIVILFALLALWGSPQEVAQAAVYTVGNEADLNQAIIDANTSPEADTITLLADITLTGPLTTITSEITINGNGYTLDGAATYQVLNSSGSLTINYLTISNGLSLSGGGGGIYNTGTLTINNSSFISNWALSSDPFGGGLYNVGGTVIINNSTFSNNIAVSGGAIRNRGTMTINNSTISGNSVAGGYGGGITNSPLFTLTLNNTTIANNIAGNNNGGGIRNDGTLNYSRTIVANNTGGDCSLGGQQIIGTNIDNLVEDNSCSPTYSGDPNLDPLADNGGPTQTHALPSGSTAIDKVPTGASTDNIDQRGAARDYGTGGDIGAYEFRQTLSWGDCSTELSGSHDFDFSGRIVSIAINAANGLNCITVEQMSSPHLLGNPGIQLTNNWWHITGNVTNGFDVNLTLPTTYSPDEGDLVCRYTGTDWDCAEDSMSSSSITRNNVSEFSDWAIYEDQAPTAVTLSSLTAEAHHNTIQVSWQTASEIDLLGFNLYRSNELLNQVMIPPANPPGSITGTSYQFTDWPVEAGETYEYVLETITISGQKQLAPITVTAPYTIYIPVMQP